MGVGGDLQDCVKDFAFIFPTLWAGKGEKINQNMMSQFTHTSVMYRKGNEWDFTFEDGVVA